MMVLLKGKLYILLKFGFVCISDVIHDYSYLINLIFTKTPSFVPPEPKELKVLC